jgi:hypothetical protein
VVEGQIPAIPPHEYISYQKPKRNIRARTFQDCETTNIVNSQVRNNTRAVVVEHPNTEQYKNSLCIRTAIDWNHLENSLVRANMRRNRWYLPLNHFVKEYQSLVLSPGL